MRARPISGKCTSRALKAFKKSSGDGRFDFEEKAGGEVLLKAQEKELLIRLGGDTDGGLGAFERAYRFVMENAGDSKKKKGGLRVMYAALSSMLRSLDPFSTFVSPESYKQMRVEYTGRYGGVGVIITLREKKLTVISPIEDTPAYRAGLKSEDVILEIDGTPTADMALFEVVRRMRGPAGKAVDLLISRVSWPKPRNVKLRRAIIKIRSVKTGGEERRDRLFEGHGLSWPHDAGTGCGPERVDSQEGAGDRAGFTRQSGRFSSPIRPGFRKISARWKYGRLHPGTKAQRDGVFPLSW